MRWILSQIRDVPPLPRYEIEIEDKDIGSKEHKKKVIKKRKDDLDEARTKGHYKCPNLQISEPDDPYLLTPEDATIQAGRWKLARIRFAFAIYDYPPAEVHDKDKTGLIFDKGKDSRVDKEEKKKKEQKDKTKTDTDIRTKNFETYQVEDPFMIDGYPI